MKNGETRPSLILNSYGVSGTRLVSISPSSKKITFIAQGGDIVTFLDLDFSNREDVPHIAYEVEGGLP
jgi:hypothetical protein